MKLDTPFGEVDFEVHLEARCPFCKFGQRFLIGEGQGEGTEEPWVGVLHDQPYCAEYGKLEPDEFVKACRLEFEKGIN